MKNSAVKALVKAQYNLQDEDIIDVTFLYVIGSTYTFRVIWKDSINVNEIQLDITST